MVSEKQKMLKSAFEALKKANSFLVISAEDLDKVQDLKEDLNKEGVWHVCYGMEDDIAISIAMLMLENKTLSDIIYQAVYAHEQLEHAKVSDN